MSKNVSEIVVESLVLAGVRRIYGIAGDSLNGITESIRTNEDIDWISVRHEEVAAFAAGAEAHLTQRIAVCAGSCGPGNLHLINGLYDAHRSRVPVLAIAAHIPSREIGSRYFQETHPESIFRECSDYCELISHVDQMPRALTLAINSAISNRGVSVLILPGDIALQVIDAEPITLQLPHLPPGITPSEGDINQMAEAINSARRVTILAGAGCAAARAELLELADLAAAPIVHAMRGKEYIEYDNPFDVGMTGLLGFSSGYRAMESCDTLLVLGTDFPYQQFYPKRAKVIQVDIRGDQIGRRTKVDLGIVGEVGLTLRAVNHQLQRKSNRKHLDNALKNYQEARKNLDDLAVGTPGKTPIHPQFVAKKINELAADNAIFCCDVGTPTVWAARYLRMNGVRRLLGSFNHGSMANALPQAIGAQLTHPDRQVITLSGDGGLAMLMGDMLTLKQVKLPVKIVVFKNNSLGFVELEMKAAGLIDFATDLENPNFGSVAEACGMLGLSATLPEHVEPMLIELFEHNGPGLLEVEVNRQELSMPPALTAEQIKGFTLYMLKAVMSGRGDEVIDLAKNQLFR